MKEDACARIRVNRRRPASLDFVEKAVYVWAPDKMIEIILLLLHRKCYILWRDDFVFKMNWKVTSRAQEPVSITMCAVHVFLAVSACS